MRPDQRLKIADRVSTIFGPVPMGVLLGLAVGVHSARALLAGAGWGLLSVACAAVLPALATAPLRKRRPRTRRVRLEYMSLAIVGAAVGLWLLWIWPAPSDVRVLAAGFAAGLCCSAAVNVLYASSNHVAALAGGAVLGAGLLSIWLLASAVLVAVVAWSRLAIGQHTLNQVLVGAVVGATSSLVVLLASASFA